MIEIEALVAKGQRVAQKTPVVRRALGQLHPTYLRSLDQGVHHFRGQLGLERRLVGLGHPSHPTGRKPFAISGIVGPDFDTR